jgi:hypothetical protein
VHACIKLEINDISDGKHHRKTPLGRPSYKYKANIKVDSRAGKDGVRM